MTISMATARTFAQVTPERAHPAHRADGTAPVRRAPRAGRATGSPRHRAPRRHLSRSRLPLLRLPAAVTLALALALAGGAAAFAATPGTLPTGPVVMAAPTQQPTTAPTFPGPSGKVNLPTSTVPPAPTVTFTLVPPVNPCVPHKVGGVWILCPPTKTCMPQLSLDKWKLCPGNDGPTFTAPPSTPPASTPPVSTPPVSTPPVSTPPVSTPPGNPGTPGSCSDTDHSGTCGVVVLPPTFTG